MQTVFLLEDSAAVYAVGPRIGQGSIARLSCHACEFEKRENRLGSKKGPGLTGNRASGGSGGQHVARQQTNKRNREKERFSY